MEERKERGSRRRRDERALRALASRKERQFHLQPGVYKMLNLKKSSASSHSPFLDPDLGLTWGFRTA